MTNNLWSDFKSKLLKPENPILIYIGLTVVIFLVVKLFGVDNLILEYFAFPARPNQWVNRFYTILTHQFIDLDFFKLLFNMLWLYWIGQLFLDFTKPHQFHLVYLGGGFFGVVFFGLIFNLLPGIQSNSSLLFGSSASVMAILVATATLVPNYSIQLMFFGLVRIKFIVLVYVLFNVLSSISYVPAISLAHLGGALFGFTYVKFLQSGTDLSAIFKKKPKLRVVKNEAPKKSQNIVNQKEVDAVLDKISKSGYDKLTKDEKETLFRASKN